MYLALKLLHVLGVTVFLGNIITGIFWKAHADKSRDPRLIAHALDGIVRSDQVFTVPGVVVIALTGFAAAVVAGLPLLRTAWLSGGIALFTISGIAFMARVAPLQRQMLALARSGTDASSFDWAAYARLSRAWGTWGAVSLITPLIAAALMVLKPVW